MGHAGAMNITRTHLLLSTVALTLWAGDVWADERETVVVYGVETRTPELSRGGLSALTAVIEDTVVHSGKYQVLGRNDMERLRSEAQFQLSEECKTTEGGDFACYVELGGAAGANTHITSSVPERPWSITIVLWGPGVSGCWTRWTRPVAEKAGPSMTRRG